MRNRSGKALQVNEDEGELAFRYVQSSPNILGGVIGRMQMGQSSFIELALGSMWVNLQRSPRVHSPFAKKIQGVALLGRAISSFSISKQSSS